MLLNIFVETVILTCALIYVFIYSLIFRININNIDYMFCRIYIYIYILVVGRYAC